MILRHHKANLFEKKRKALIRVNCEAFSWPGMGAQRDIMSVERAVSNQQQQQRAQSPYPPNTTLITWQLLPTHYPGEDTHHLDEIRRIVPNAPTTHYTDAQTFAQHSHYQQPNLMLNYDEGYTHSNPAT